ncbi:hypothetical protein OS176_07790 [Xanthomonadaceae bacterium XH05]|nr:hypothetical protein [Xanthomonadaceae bacterium XH05]
MSTSDVRATVVDLTSGEAAAMSLSEGLLPVIHATQENLAAKHGDKDAWLFHSVFIARYMGFVCATFGAEGALSLLDGMAQAVRETAARRGKAH